MLVLILRQRFGVLPETVIARVAAADLALIHEWGTRVATAPTLDDVLGR